MCQINKLEKYELELSCNSIKNYFWTTFVLSHVVFVLSYKRKDLVHLSNGTKLFEFL